MQNFHLHLIFKFSFIGYSCPACQRNCCNVSFPTFLGRGDRSMTSPTMQRASRCAGDEMSAAAAVDVMSFSPQRHPTA